MLLAGRIVWFLVGKHFYFFKHSSELLERRKKKKTLLGFTEIQSQVVICVSFIEQSWGWCCGVRVCVSDPFSTLLGYWLYIISID